MGFFLRALQRTKPALHAHLSRSSSPLMQIRWFTSTQDLHNPEAATLEFQCTRCSTLSGTHNSLPPQTETLSFIKSSFNELEGPNHRWLNYMDGKRKSFNQDGIFLVLVNAFIKDSKLLHHRELIGALERVKLIQQRFPEHHVFGLHCDVSINSVTAHTQIIQTIMEEYVTFPILISDNDFLKMIQGPCYLLFDGCTNHLSHHKLDIELGTIIQAIKDFNVVPKHDTILFQNSNNDKTREHQVVEEPSIWSSLRNLPLHYPGCVSVDENGRRLFISDSNHHRIIITDGAGKILDCIGSSPGFEDGEFESSRLQRPAASFYDHAENYLYFVDSQNHAIRRADMEKRVLETLYPVSLQKTHGIWSWILDKLGLARENDKKAEGFDFDSLRFPWHLFKLREMELLIINRSFETAWIMSMTTGEIKDILRGPTAILEISEHMIMEKVSLMKDIHRNCSQETLDHSFSLGRVLHVDLVSSLAKFEKNIVFCDSAAQRILKFDRESRSTSYIQFSEFEVLGLPYWLICPLERVPCSGYMERSWHEHCHHETVLPGRCDIRVNVEIPKGTELAAPLEEGCIWRQVRGSAAEVSGSEELEEKVGVAQQWYDELDNLAFSNSEIESGLQDGQLTKDRSLKDKNKVHFDCAVSISPGTSEIVVSAVLYLQLKMAQDTRDRGPENDACIQFLLETRGDGQDTVFMKPLHLRIKLECADHPTALTSKETITVDSTFEVNVFLD